MSRGFVVDVKVRVEAPAARVWRALTEPDLIRRYLFGTEVTCDWRPGSPVTYRGVWKGKAYEDKGRILQAEEGRRLVSTFWSSLEGRPDLPENYKTVSWELTPEGAGTLLHLTQDNAATPQEAEHSRGNWEMVMGKMKEIVEGLG